MIFFQAASRADRAHATFRAINDGRVTLCLSPALVAEIQDVLNRDSLRAKFPTLTPDAVSIFITDTLAHGTMFDPVPRAFTWPQHLDDDHLFNLAIHAKAKYLVTWETRILTLATETTPAAELLRKLAPDLAIVTPKQLADILKVT
jgi:predicted nucleic acid-binding protein